MKQRNLKKLPVGIQTFSEIRKDNYLYVDKTKIALDLIQNNKYIFLSRPRRFGKSLFLDTLKNIFEAKKEYFDGLYIENRWSWDVSFPVINISFASGRLESRKDLKERWEEILYDNEQKLGLKCYNNIYNRRCFSDLIKNAYKKYNQKVVILLDEYDKPLLDNIDDVELSKDMRNELVNFYSVIKDSDRYIKFAYLTGVSKFTKTSIFSGLNNITDISLDKRYGDICGYTQNDIETSFLPYLKDQDFNKIKKWYNGYNFLKSDMYNPFDILKFIQHDFMYKSYWFESGTPTFLMKLIKKNDYYLPKLSSVQVGEELMESFDIENFDFEVLLYQTGYLTIDKMREKRRGGFEYTLKIPNEEVKISLNNYIINYLIKTSSSKLKIQDDIYDALVDEKLELLKSSLTAMFASIPYNNYTKNDIASFEGFYATVIYVYLQSLGLNIIGEDATNRGRIDLTIKLDTIIYIIEFKIGNDDALKQIKERNYHQKYTTSKKDIYLVGINFDENKKNISSFEWVKI
ncbi:MAG: AAA family ATPase [Campylobacterota bacterium]|nr:AAA family ATPase [Campylobacterota bacterium]